MLQPHEAVEAPGSDAPALPGPGAQPRIVVMGRLALYGPAAARLHEAPQTA